MKKNNKYIDENLTYISENTTPYQRLLWLKKAFNFWKMMQKRVDRDASAEEKNGGPKRIKP